MVPPKGLPENKTGPMKDAPKPNQPPPSKSTADKKKRIDDFDAYEGDPFWGSDHICWSGYNTKSDTNSDAYKATSP